MKLGFIFGLFLLVLSLNAQVFVQLELFNDPSAKKYSVGDKITYKTHYNNDVWAKGKIESILINENTLVLNNEILPLDQVSHFMLYRPTIQYFGGTVQSFGLIWLVQGSIAAIFDKNTSFKSVLAIGGSTFIGGYLFRKAFYKVPITLGPKNRLRIIDLRFSVPDEMPKSQ